MASSLADAEMVVAGRRLDCNAVRRSSSPVKLLGRSLLVLGIVVVAVAGYLAWSTYGSWPVPSGYSFPRHSMWGGPDALYAGTLKDVDGCIRAAGEESFAVVWPPGYRLSVEDGEPVVHGGSRQVRIGEQVRMGGGYYEDGLPPPESRDIGACAPPFFLSTGFSE
jgi:hypothetical protein